MRLTRQARPHSRSAATPSSADDSFPTTQLFIIAICRFAEPVALTSIFPYSWVMVRDFHIGDESNASFYAGILISAFSLAESLTGMFWGGLSDKIGRKPVLLIGCSGTMLSLLIVGFSVSFWMALAGRIIGGLLNGNIGVLQTMVGELVKKPEHEPRAYAVLPFVWSLGTIIGPAIGGSFSKPTESFPSLFPPSGLFGKLPYLLPNLVCSALLLMSIIAGWLFLKETHPDMQPSVPAVEGHEDNEEAQEFGAALVPVSSATAHSGADLRSQSYGTFNQVEMHEDEEWDLTADGKRIPRATLGVAFTYRVTMLIIALSIYTYHSMTYDHLLPIFLQDSRTGTASLIPSSLLHVPGGLAISTQRVGLIMAVNGFIALVIQAVVFPLFAEWLGVWHVFVMVTVLHPIAYFIVPFLAFVPQDWLYSAIYACLTIRNFFSILAYPVLLILIKQASPSNSVLGKINGLAASAGAACRTVAPPIAGYLYSIGSRIGFTGISWWASSVVAIVGAFQLVFMTRKRHATVSVFGRAPCFPPRHEQRPQEVIHVRINDNQEPYQDEP
ncbi:hypothetical protein VTO42DRAFT_8847 [Malbranchea cinnamomea]